MNNINIKAKKSLGQNFLKSKKALSDMLSAGEVGENDIVLEAGPGKGVLTEELLKKAGKVIAVEKDDVLVEFLRQKFSAEIASGKLQLVHGDILEFNPATYHLQPKTYNLPLTTYHLQPTTFSSQPTTFKLIANIPYYITGQFLRKFLSGDIQPSKMVILLQKEVVKRIMANDGKESILSISVKAYGRPKNVGKVSKENFSPKPKVDSAILLIDNISRDFFKDIASEEKFFQIVKAGFAHKRKLLARNIEHLAKDKEQIEKIFKNCGIPPKARAEDLKIEQWKCLSFVNYETPLFAEHA
ncbi:MAG: Ribosomal small subunit methyltransferase [Parcubacteria group bacterium]|nr:Ribosomal small subunit methyltransferase [Parcubacteria group bacterium]